MEFEVKNGKTEDKKKPVISTEHLKKNPRISKIKLQDQRFFAYEKQRSHN
jgi:hypothetical protein